MIPDWVLVMPIAESIPALCPYCLAEITPPPKRGRACLQCGETYHVRKCPDGIRRILTRAAMIEVECIWAEDAAVGQVIAIQLTDSTDAAGNQHRWNALEQELRQGARDAVLRSYA